MPPLPAVTASIADLGTLNIQSFSVRQMGICTVISNAMSNDQVPMTNDHGLNLSTLVIGVCALVIERVIALEQQIDLPPRVATR